eukprot:scaffold3160_cov162-Pinguiococcus_pyrenoidosus.AAC.1
MDCDGETVITVSRSHPTVPIWPLGSGDRTEVGETASVEAEVGKMWIRRPRGSTSDGPRGREVLHKSL